MENYIEIGSQIIAFVVLVAGAVWGFLKFFKRDEHFPRVVFEVSANFVGHQDDQVLFEVIAELENKGVVPLKIKNLVFKVRGLYDHEELGKGDESIRGQTRIPHVLLEGSWIPKNWSHTFVYPGVKTEYNYICLLYTSPSPRDQRGSRMPSSA